MTNTTGLTIDLDQAVPVSKAELDAELDAVLSKFQEDDDVPLSPALRTIQQEKKQNMNPPWEGSCFAASERFGLHSWHVTVASSSLSAFNWLANMFHTL
jgi:hypothetical protein